MVLSLKIKIAISITSLLALVYTVVWFRLIDKEYFILAGPTPRISRWRGQVLYIELEFNASQQDLYGNIFAYQKSEGFMAPPPPPPVAWALIRQMSYFLEALDVDLSRALTMVLQVAKQKPTIIAVVAIFASESKNCKKWL